MSHDADVPAGRIDIHSHLIPAVDDGCQSEAESLECVGMLRGLGYVGTVCTPHLWPEMFPENTPANVARWVERLRGTLRDAGVEYRVWTGGELRVYPKVVEWMKAVGVPTLAGSKLVLCDFWEPKWRAWIDDCFDWLLAEGYTPVLAHPERLSIPKGLPEKLAEVTARGVLLQGNFRCMTGEDGRLADEQIRAWLPEGRYTFLAMDMHRPNALPARIDGFEMVRREHGEALLDEMTIARPRRMVLGLSG